MGKPRPFKELRDKLPKEVRDRVEERIKQTRAEMPLHQLRSARELTQENLAEILGVNQAAISKLERRTDMYISTLARFIEAMGGTLDIRAVFPEGAVSLKHLGEDNAQATEEARTASRRK